MLFVFRENIVVVMLEDNMKLLMNWVKLSQFFISSKNNDSHQLLEQIWGKTITNER